MPLRDDILLEKNYKNIFKGDSSWEAIKIKSSSTFNWSINSTYIKKPPFLENEFSISNDIFEARPLLILGDSITTDHISPAGAIKPDSPAGKYLYERQIKREEFNSYGSRRGNHEIMMRGTFAYIRIKNEIIPESEGGITKFFDTLPWWPYRKSGSTTHRHCFPLSSFSLPTFCLYFFQ